MISIDFNVFLLLSSDCNKQSWKRKNNDKTKAFSPPFFFFLRVSVFVLQIKLFIFHTYRDEQFNWTWNFIPVTFSGYRQALLMTSNYSSQLRPFLPMTADFTQAAWRRLEEKSASVKTFPKFSPSKPVPPVTQPSKFCGTTWVEWPCLSPFWLLWWECPDLGACKP